MAERMSLDLVFCHFDAVHYFGFKFWSFVLDGDDLPS
jgi:hypothetical protein